MNVAQRMNVLFRLEERQGTEREGQRGYFALGSDFYMRPSEGKRRKRINSILVLSLPSCLPRPDFPLCSAEEW